MARYTGPVCRLCRQEGVKLFLKGDKCRSFKCTLEKRDSAPGQHGKAKKQKSSEYGVQLREKQKVKRMYAMLERQFRKYFAMAEQKKGVTGENLLLFLEQRLDNVIYKIGIAPSRKLARQLIVHKHFRINGKYISRPSYFVKAGDVISIKETSKNSAAFKTLIEKKEQMPVPPSWLAFSPDTLEGKVIRLPKRDDISMPVNEQLIVELYSK